MMNHPKFGQYVTWPEDFNPDAAGSTKQKATLTSTKVGSNFGLSAQRMNSIFSELGWIAKNTVLGGGWDLTDSGKRVGGAQVESSNGFPYVIWPENITANKWLLDSINAATGTSYAQVVETSAFELDTDEFRKKHPANYRTQDGHRVRSRAEAMIDDYLYTNGIAHAYEKRLPILDHEVISDFYIPEGRVYIEFWGMEENEQYRDRKLKKLEIYRSNDIKLIEMNNQDLERLDDVLPVMLRKHGVRIG